MLHCFRRNAAKTISNGAELSRDTILKRRANYLSSTSRSQQENETFTLANGHTIGFSTCGSANAPALFFFHGQCSSRLHGLGLAESANSVGLRIICPDRPGLGLSTLDPRRTLLDYPPQIAQLASYLGLETYRVMGASGGGPYAVVVVAESSQKGYTDQEITKACAYATPRTQLKGAAILAGVGPPDDASFSHMRLGTRMLFAGLHYAPGLVGMTADVLIGKKAREPNPEVLRKTVARQMKYVKAMLTPNERKLFERQPEIIDEIVQDFRETFRQGPKGFVRDGQLNVEPWGFRLEDVPFAGVRLYYGSEDTNTPARMGRNMAAKLKGAMFNEYDGETHMTLFDNHGDDILRDIVEHESSR